MYAIAATVLGGTSLTRTAEARSQARDDRLAVIAVINNGMNLMQINSTGRRSS